MSPFGYHAIPIKCSNSDNSSNDHQSTSLYPSLDS